MDNVAFNYERTHFLEAVERIVQSTDKVYFVAAAAASASTLQRYRCRHKLDSKPSISLTVSLLVKKWKTH
jgi:hypothetical protein